MTATIHDAIAELHTITDVAMRDGSRVGYFAALYARVTQTVADRIQEGFFEDGAWLERLDVLFATRYLEALRCFRAREQGVTASWRLAFEACSEPAPTVLQHLYLGMNAHLLVDLPLALVEACEGRVPWSRRADFLKINEIVMSLMPRFHEDLGKASRRLGALQRHAGAAWAAGSRVVLMSAREIAWLSARQLARRPVETRPALAARLDARAAWVGRQILDAGPVGRRVFAAIRAGEGEDVRAVIVALRRA